MSLALWNDVLSDFATDRGHPSPVLHLRRDDGSSDVLPVSAWAGQLDFCDRMLLQSLQSRPGPVLDVGCGPGRLAAATARAGLPSLARARGASAAVASVFDVLPHSGPWRHVLLIDGNVGIGGSPTALLRRCRDLLDDRGTVHAEINPPGRPERSGQVRLERHPDGALGEWFPWAEVSVAGLSRAARAAGLSISRIWTRSGRWFAEMVVGRG
jgi:SAM-dependent methyltransferase